MKKSLSALFVLALAACTAHPGPADDGHVHASGQAITVSGHTAIGSISGTYQTCREHADGAPWSVSTGGALPYPVLSIVQHDAPCQLTITSVADTGASYAVGPTIALSIAFKASASGLTDSGGHLVSYANAKADALNYDANFNLTLLVSDNAEAIDATVGASKVHVTATALVQTVPAPNYGLDVSSLVVNTDATDTVSGYTGAAVLTPGSQPGEQVVIVQDGALPDSASLTWENVANVYTTHTKTPIAGSYNGNALALGGTVLPQVRHLIVSHTESGVSSFEVLTITFTP